MNFATITELDQCTVTESGRTGVRNSREGARSNQSLIFFYFLPAARKTTHGTNQKVPECHWMALLKIL